MTRNAGDYPSHATNVQPATGWSDPLNETWPPAELARRLQDVPVDKQIAVVARLVFETGTEYLEGFATRWEDGKPYVRIAIADSRLRSGGVWLHPSDARPALEVDAESPR